MNQEMEFSLNNLLFVALVRDFESMAMVGFGKLVDPVSQNADRNLERSKVAIDMLGMLEEKTKGNLNNSEASLLQQVLTNLRLNYVDELEKDKKAEAGGAEGAKTTPEPSTVANADEKAAGGGAKDEKAAGGGALKGKAAGKGARHKKGPATGGGESGSSTSTKANRKRGAGAGKDGSEK